MIQITLKKFSLYFPARGNLNLVHLGSKDYFFSRNQKVQMFSKKKKKKNTVLIYTCSFHFIHRRVGLMPYIFVAVSEWNWSASRRQRRISCCKINLKLSVSIDICNRGNLFGIIKNFMRPFYNFYNLKNRIEIYIFFYP
jgi:hypothetical protein